VRGQLEYDSRARQALVGGVPHAVETPLPHLQHLPSKGEPHHALDVCLRLAGLAYEASLVSGMLALDEGSC
jgi:hypothetical protein